MRRDTDGTVEGIIITMTEVGVIRQERERRKEIG